MTDIDDIPADTSIDLTEDLVRAFKSVGCDPRCHNCGEELVIGEPFKLAYVKVLQYYTGWTLEHAEDQADEVDEMLCDSCSPEDLYKSRLISFESDRIDAENRMNRRGRYRGYTRKHIP